MEYPLTKRDHFTGLLAAMIILALWFANLIFLLRADVSPGSWYLVPLFVLQILLYTGLFITAHDSMHGVVSHRNRRLNDFIGRLALTLFALFPLQRMVPKHRQHHSHPASPDDPDFHDGVHKSFGAWYAKFFIGYMSWIQLIGLALIYNLMHYLLGIAHLNLILFWVLPSLLSSVQLFYFGTYLPHRERSGGYPDEHRAYSNEYPVWFSFITCYHFGYHHEHHSYPWIPWWKLPRVRENIRFGTFKKKVTA